MKHKFLPQLWLATRIWMLAVAANTTLGTLYLAWPSVYNAGFYIVIGTVYGAVYALPVMLAILLIINRCAAAEKNGLWLFRLVFIVGIALTVVVFLTFWATNMGAGDSGKLILLCIAVLSGIIGMATFYKPLLKWGGDFNTIQEI